MKMSVGAPFALGLCAKRVRKVGSTVRGMSVGFSDAYTEGDRLFVMKSANWSRFLDPDHRVVSAIEVTV